jgi:hypothetical protein
MLDIPPAQASNLLRLVRQGLTGLFCLVVLLGVLSMYLQPDFLLTLANQVWGCF